MANGQWLKAEKDLRSPKAPQNLLVNQIVFFRAEAWKGSTRTHAVATLGYNLVNINLWSRIAQNIFLHNAFEIKLLNYSVNYAAGVSSGVGSGSGSGAGCSVEGAEVNAVTLFEVAIDSSTGLP